MTNSYYITTPIYYVNDSPHLGHAYTTIACDIAARNIRLEGEDVFFLTGTDEHGQKIDKAANAAGTDPQKFTDLVSQRFKALVNANVDGNKTENLLNITNDDFIRTTEQRHKIACGAFWNKIKESGYIYLDKYSGWYAVRDEAYYQESELVNGKAPSGAEVEWIEEESYFFALSKFQDKLLKFYEENPDCIKPRSRYNEVVSFVKSGLKDLSISRTNFSWGVPVPDAPKHVMYVWIDALTNYLTATGYPNESEPKFQKFWKNGNVTHVVGKDILRFHAVYWPAFLMAADLMPKKLQIFAHGWWTVEGEKMSKSLGNVIAPRDLIESYGLEQIRYYLFKAMPFGNDGDLSKNKLIETCNADLSNNIGNLAQRTLSLVLKNCEGKIPQFEESSLTDDDKKLIEETRITGDNKKFIEQISDFDFYSILTDLTKISSYANEYIDKNAPWVLKKENPTRMNSVLYHLCEAIRCIAIMLQPYCPESSGRILEQLNVPASNRNFKELKTKYYLKPGTAINTPQPAFVRLEVKKDSI